MMITTGTGPTGKHAAVELTDDDMRSVHADWDTKPLLERHRAMMNTGDLLMVDYLRASGEITAEFARARVSEIKSRYEKGHQP